MGSRRGARRAWPGCGLCALWPASEFRTASTETCSIPAALSPPMTSVGLFRGIACLMAQGLGKLPESFLDQALGCQGESWIEKAGRNRPGENARFLSPWVISEVWDSPKRCSTSPPACHAVGGAVFDGKLG